MSHATSQEAVVGYYPVQPLEAAVFFCCGVPAEELVRSGRAQFYRIALPALKRWCAMSSGEASRLIDAAWPYIVNKAMGGLTWDQQVAWAAAVKRYQDKARGRKAFSLPN